VCLKSSAPAIEVSTFYVIRNLQEFEIFDGFEMNIAYKKLVELFLYGEDPTPGSCEVIPGSVPAKTIAVSAKAFTEFWYRTFAATISLASRISRRVRISPVAHSRRCQGALKSKNSSTRAATSESKGLTMSIMSIILLIGIIPTP
jgi:hypothetical protein